MSLNNSTEEPDPKSNTGSDTERERPERPFLDRRGLGVDGGDVRLRVGVGGARGGGGAKACAKTSVSSAPSANKRLGVGNPEEGVDADDLRDDLLGVWGAMESAEKSGRGWLAEDNKFSFRCSR
jgi:hypothetical protein